VALLYFTFTGVTACFFHPSLEHGSHHGMSQHMLAFCDKASLLSAVYLCRILLNSDTNMSSEFEEKHGVTFINV
jgi:hypothetical protein